MKNTGWSSAIGSRIETLQDKKVLDMFLATLQGCFVVRNNSIASLNQTQSTIDQ